MSGKLKGFTLLELLVAVAIFSGLAVLTLGIFARSAASSIKSGVSRQRTEAARNIVDRVSNDLRYVYLNQTVTNAYTLSGGDCASSDPLIGFGFNSSSDCIVMVLKYPRASTNPYVWKMYRIVPDGTVKVSERRDCSINTSGVISCPAAINGNILAATDNYKAEYSPTVFTGITPYAGSIATPDKITPILRLKLTVKPSDIDGPCTDPLNKPKCYSISTAITTGATQ